ncbi:Regulatory protein, LuxR:Response regulator receiver [hydrothermal vent metagenome]|uniref:Regulatory protein, LuxR:Response regulator receiver n=1 Tax=hydrothermal vent metagenome TaxID=652676 RepID=A0A1W1E9S2_9ZZZZ
MEQECHAVLVVDDHDIVCAGIKALLEKCQICKNQVIDTAVDYSGMMHFLREKKYNILILDLHLGDVNTFSSIRKLSKAFPAMKIFVCSMYPEDPYAIECIHEGAVGYLHKRHVLESFKDAVSTIIKGDIYLNPEYAQCLSYGTAVKKREKPSLNALSKREFEICHYIVSGLSFKQIAQKLNISSKTVSAHHAHILEKLSLSNTAQLIHFVLQHKN